jgi:cell division protein FtsZ
VLGTTDIGSRSPAQRRLLAGARGSQTPFSKPAPPKAVTTTPVAPNGPPAPAAPAPAVEQNEFSFNEVESRGFFDKTDRNLFEGQDLDVPTYLRKGIKIGI